MISRHWGHLLEPFYPIVDDWNIIEQIKTTKFSLKYLLIIIVSTYLSIDTIVAFSIVGYDVKNPYLFQHIVLGFMPEYFRSQGDLIFYLAFPLYIFIYCNLMSDNYPHLIHVLFPSQHNFLQYSSIFQPKIDGKLNALLKEFWFKTKNRFTFLNKMFEIQINLAFTIPIIIYELYRIFFIEEYQTSFRIWFFAFLTIIFIHYYIVILFIGFNFVILNLLINIKQTYITQEFEQFRNDGNNQRKLNLILKNLLKHTQEINDYNKFYSKYISAIIVCFCLWGSLLLDATIHPPGVPMIIMLPWGACEITYFLSIALFSASSSKTIFLNRRIFKRLRILQVSLCNSQITSSKQNLVHLDLVNEYQPLLYKTCFRVITKSVLNNKFWLFEIMSYILVIYFQIVYKY